jgi:hypothetical protein
MCEMTRLVEASRWVFFDVHATSAATGAHVAMALRERLPTATIRSAPGSTPSDDERLPHLLHCRGAFAGATAEQARDSIGAALLALDVLAGAGGQARAIVLFREDETDTAVRAA